MKIQCLPNHVKLDEIKIDITVFEEMKAWILENTFKCSVFFNRKAITLIHLTPDTWVLHNATKMHVYTALDIDTLLTSTPNITSVKLHVETSQTGTLFLMKANGIVSLYRTELNQILNWDGNGELNTSDGLKITRSKKGVTRIEATYKEVANIIFITEAELKELEVYK